MDSVTAVLRASAIENAESMPRKISMRKKSSEKKFEPGIIDSAFGKATKARPGPPSVTSATQTRCSVAMKPRTEKTVMAETRENTELAMQMTEASLTTSWRFGLNDA